MQVGRLPRERFNSSTRTWDASDVESVRRLGGHHEHPPFQDIVYRAQIQDVFADRPNEEPPIPEVEQSYVPVLA